jgi:signal transduction histidine kinase
MSAVAAPASFVVPRNARLRAWLRLAPAQWSLARQFLLASLVVVVAGVLITGAWIGHQIESSVLDRTAFISALYVNSVIGTHLQTLAQDDRTLGDADVTALDRLIQDTGGLGQGVVLFKVWSVDGRVLYSYDRALIGKVFPVNEGLDKAVHGEVSAEMSDLNDPENTDERQNYQRLVEVYAPLRDENGGKVIGVNEFYLLPNALDAEVQAAQARSWAIVAAIGLATYVLLAGIVKRGSDTIRRQQDELGQRVRELQRLLDQNRRLHQRVLEAAGRTTTLNEQALRRISADLHDGPGQALALALLRLDDLDEPCKVCTRGHSDFGTVHAAVRDALEEMRTIAAGLRIPQLEELTLFDVAERAISDHERRSGTPVKRDFGKIPDQAPLPVKIALRRTLQEALSNATRHAGGAGVVVSMHARDGNLELAIRDSGPGFDPRTVEPSDHLGLAGMRERAELLGGSFSVTSSPRHGTIVDVVWPLPSDIAA